MVFVGAVPEWEEKNHFYTEVVQKAVMRKIIRSRGCLPPSCNVPVDNGGTVFFRYTPSSDYGNTINVWINTPDFSEAIGPVPATPVQTANAEACSVDNRFDLTIPQVELTDSAGNKYTFSGVQHLHRLNGPPARTEGK